MSVDFVGVDFSYGIQRIIEINIFGTAVKVIFSHMKPPTFSEKYFFSRNLTKEIKLELK